MKKNKTMSLVFGAGILTACTMISSNAYDATLYKVNNNIVNVRKSYSKNSEKVGELFNGEYIEVISTKDGWSKIEYNNKASYVKSEFLTKSSGDYIITAKQFARMRKNPTSSSGTEIVAEVPRNSVVKVVRIENDWAYVKYNNKYGYIHTDYIKMKTTLYESTATNGVNVRNLPSVNSTEIGDIPKGHVVDVISIKDGWAKVYYKDKIAYASTKYLNKLKIDRSKEDTVSGIYYVSTDKVLNIRSGPGSNYDIVSKLNNDTKVKVVEVKHIAKEGSKDKSKWVKIEFDNKIGWCNLNYLSRVKSTATKEEKLEMMMRVAKEQLGKDYEFGVTGVNTFDCSGLTGYIFKKGAGIDLTRFSYTQANEGRVLYWNTVDETKESLAEINSKIKKGELNFKTNLNEVKFQFGDLLFFNTSDRRVEGINHVAMYIGNGKYIHAPKEGDVVRINNIGDSYTDKTLRKITRVFN